MQDTLYILYRFEQNLSWNCTRVPRYSTIRYCITRLLGCKCFLCCVVFLLLWLNLLLQKVWCSVTEPGRKPWFVVSSPQQWQDIIFANCHLVTSRCHQADWVANLNKQIDLQIFATWQQVDVCIHVGWPHLYTRSGRLTVWTDLKRW